MGDESVKAADLSAIAEYLGLASVGLKAILDNLPALLAALGVPAEKS